MKATDQGVALTIAAATMSTQGTSTMQDQQLVKFGAALQEERTGKGLSRDAMARRAGGSVANLTDWEKGKGFPSAVQFKRLTHVLTRLRRFRDVMPWAPRANDVPTPTGQPLTFGDALKATRMAEGLEPHEVAELLGTGVTRSAVYEWEADRGFPVEKNYDALVVLFPTLAAFPLVKPPRAIEIPKGATGHGPPSAKPTPIEPLAPLELASLRATLGDAGANPETQLLRRLIATIDARDAEIAEIGHVKAAKHADLDAAHAAAVAEITRLREELAAATAPRPSTEPEIERVSVDPEEIVAWYELVAEVRAASALHAIVSLLETTQALRIRPSRLIAMLDKRIP